MTNSKKEQTMTPPPQGKRMQGGGPRGGHGGMGEKPKNFKMTLKKMANYLKNHRTSMLIAMILTVAATVLSILGPDFVSKITNEIGKSIPSLAEMSGGNIDIANYKVDMKAVTTIGITLVCMYGAGVIFNYIQGYIMSTVTAKVSRKMRTQLSKKINSLPLKYFDSTSHGNIMSRVSNDVDTVARTLNESVASLVSSVIMIVGVLVMMFYHNWIMALSAIGTTLFGFVLMSFILKGSQKYFKAQAAQLGRINGHIEEVYSGHNVVKAYNGEAKAKKDFDSINMALKDSGWKSQFFSGIMMPMMGFIGNFGFVTVCIVGAMLLKNGAITIGTITAFMIYIRLFTNPLSQVAQIATSLQSSAAAGERVFEMLDEPQMEDESHKSKRIEIVSGDVNFKDVRFGYDPDKTIIKGFTAHAKSGQKIAIVGPTGAGKTTMVNLLMRFYEIDGGQILIDGIDTRTVSREEVRKQFCMVLQDTWLFEGTIRDNILFNKKSVSDEELIKACKAANIWHYIKTLPKGLDTVLSDAANLSQGQKQLMTIARAMIEDSPMLILDEATSSVDTRTEVLIQEAMDKLMKGRTSFVIAHRLSTIKNADLILVMKDGDIIEQGNHEELLKQEGFYCSLYNSQFGSEEQ